MTDSNSSPVRLGDVGSRTSDLETRLDADPVTFHNVQVTGNLTDEQNNAYIKSTGTEGSVQLENLTVTANLTGNLIVSDAIQDTEGNEYVRSTGSGGEVTLDKLRVQTSLESERIVSDRVETSTGQTFLPLERNETGTGRVDPFTIPFAGETFQNMIVDGNFVQMNGTMRGNAKYLTSFAERENENLEKRLSEFAKFSDRRIFVSSTDGNDSNHGRSWDQAVKTVRRACELAQPRTTIFVASGDYYEITPIYVRPNVAIIGDSLRTVFLYSKSWEFKEQDPNGKGERAVEVNGIDYNRRDFFHVSSGVYLYGLRFKHLESPGYCASFPAAMVDVGVDSLGRMAPLVNGTVRSDETQIPIVYSPDGYFQDNLPQTGTYPNGWDTNEQYVVVPIPLGAKIRTPFVDVSDRLKTQRDTLQDVVMNETFVDGLTDAQKELCRRDTGYLIDAMRFDFELGTYMHTYEAAFRYYYKDRREIPNNQLSSTLDAISFLKEKVRTDLDDQNLLDSDVETKLDALFFMLTDTLESPTFETILDSFTQVVIERIHVVTPGEGYTLNARVDIDSPVREGGIRAFAVPEILDENGGIKRVRVFQKGSGYIEEYRDPSFGKSIVRITDQAGAQNAVLRPVFRVETFRAWSEEAGIMRPAGSVFSPQRQYETPYRSTRVYKSFNGRFDARQIYPEDDEPCLVLECGSKLRQGAFGETALNNRGNFRLASDRMKEFRSAIQNAGIQRPEVPSEDAELRGLCFRDIGFLVDAIASDLFEGGAYESVRAANAYFTRDANGNTTSILTNAVTDQVRKTADVVRWIKDYVVETTFEDWTLEDDAIPIIEALFDGIADTIAKGDGDNLQEPDQIELNARRYVAYRLHDSNLTKWRFEGRNVRDKGWTLLDERDFTFEQREFANRTVTPSFDPDINNPGEWEVAYDRLRENRTSIQEAVIESVRASSDITLTETQYQTCFRDVGLILNAVMTDLRVGGTRFSKRAAVAYYVGNRSVLPVNQTQPTIDAIQMIKTAVLELLPSDRFENERQIVGSLIDGIIATIDAPRISVEGRYGISNSNAYHFYRLVMVQNEEDRVEDPGTMRVGRIELFEEDIPRVYVDGPEITGTVVEGVEIVNGGSQYESESPPTVKFVRGSNDPTSAPNAEAEAIVENGRVVRVRMIKNGANFLSPPTIEFESSKGGGATAVAFMGDDYARVRVDSLDPESGRINQVSIVHAGSGYEVTPTVSIAPPRRLQPFVVASPYVQNCSNISGPWDNQRYRVSEFYPLPFPLDNIYRDNPASGDIRRVNNYGSAGGIRIDGATCNPESPLRSFVVDAFTQVNQGGLGFLLTNLAYAQFVSTFGTFCTTHMKAINGSFANASNSVTDFGITGLEAYGYWTEPYTRARVVEPGDRNSTTWRSPAGMFLEGQGYFSDIRTIEWISRGEGFRPDDEVTVAIGRPEASNAIRARVVGESYESGTGRTTLDLSELSGKELEDLIIQRSPAEGLGYGQDGELFGGVGYRFPPLVTVETPPDRGNPNAVVTLSGVSVIRIQVLEGRQPDILSIARIHGNWYTVESVSEAKTPDDRDISGQYDVVFFPPVSYADLGFEINFHNVSYLSTGSHVMEYVGSGVTYNALPEYGGIPSETAETRNIEPAKVFYTTSDHRGNSKVGPRFSVNQATGAITLDASSFDLQNLEGIGPFIRNGIAIGERLRELSNNVQLRSDATGQSDSQTAPTQVAVKTYVDRRAVPPVPNEYLTKKFFLQAIQDSQTVGDFQQQYGWAELDAGDLRIEQANLRADVLTGMFVDGDTRIYGNANVGTLQVSDPERDVPLPNGALGVSVDQSSGTPALVFRFRGEDGDYTRRFDMSPVSDD